MVLINSGDPLIRESVPRQLRIVYVQHAGLPGGSMVSLRILAEGMLGKGHAVWIILADPNAEMRQGYEAIGATVVDMATLPVFRHTTGGWAHLGAPRACLYQARQLFKRNGGGAAIKALIEEIKPDVVHLNSVTLVLVAKALRDSAVPVVWHVRESPAQGYFGIRRHWLRKSLRSTADELIFLSESDRAAWVGDHRGQVIPNVVPPAKPFTPNDLSLVWRRLGLEDTCRPIAYLGGLAEIKGIFPLIQAMRIVVEAYPEARVIAPGTVLKPPASLKQRVARHVMPLIGCARDFEQADKLLADDPLSHVFLRLPFQHDVLSLLAASEFAVFPSIRPHFARPVVEAASVGRPCIGSDLAGVRDLIVHGQTGVVVPPNNPLQLAEAIKRLFAERSVTQKMGEEAAELARQRFDAAKQIDDVEKIYMRLIESRNGNSR